MILLSDAHPGQPQLTANLGAQKPQHSAQQPLHDALLCCSGHFRPKVCLTVPWDGWWVAWLGSGTVAAPATNQPHPPNPAWLWQEAPPSSLTLTENVLERGGKRGQGWKGCYSISWGHFLIILDVVECEKERERPPLLSMRITVWGIIERTSTFFNPNNFVSVLTKGSLLTYELIIWVIPVIESSKNKNVMYYLPNEFLLLEYVKYTGLSWNNQDCGKYCYKKWT